MIDVGSAAAVSSAPPAAFHAAWCDIESHPVWAGSMEYFRLDGPFEVGATGVLKSKGGEPARFRVVEVGDRTYADATELHGADLVVHHEATTEGTGSALTIRAWVEGPAAAARAADVGDISDGLQEDLESLVRLLEDR